jgi:molecular chaperone Hsp33
MEEKLTRNYIHPFLLNDSKVQGRIINLSSELDNILNKHNFPDYVNKQIAELILIAGLLGSALKTEGIITIQVVSEGAIKLMVADYNYKPDKPILCDSTVQNTTTSHKSAASNRASSDSYQGEIRGYAKIDYELINQDNPTYKELFKNGTMVITLEQGKHTEKYQGIVALEGDNLTEAISNYFKDSEQIDTIIKTAVAKCITPSSSSWVAGAIMIRKMPSEPQLADIHADDWIEAACIANTIKEHELIDPDITAKDLLFRLFHERGVWLYEPINISHQCRCSREKMLNILLSMDKKELNNYSIDGAIDMKCEFCGRTEKFIMNQDIKIE